MSTVPQTAQFFNLEQLQAVLGGRIVNAGTTLTNVNCIAPDHPGDGDSRSAWWNIHNDHIYGHCGTKACHWQKQDRAARDLLGLAPRDYTLHANQSYLAARYTSPDGRQHVDEMRFDWQPGDPACWYTLDYRTPKARPCDNLKPHKHVWHSPAGVNTAGWPALLWLPDMHRTHNGENNELADNINQQGWIIVAEGSKAARAIAQAGITSASVLGGRDAYRRFNFDCITERPVAIWPDHDKDWQKAAAATARAISPYAPTRIVVIPPNGAIGSKDDAADLSPELRISAIHGAILNPLSDLDIDANAPKPRELPQDRPAILAAGDIEYTDQVDAAWNAIMAVNYRSGTNDYHIYRRDWHLITTKFDDEDQLSIYPVEEPHIRDILARHIFWYTVTADGGIRARHPNYNIVRDIPRAPHDSIPHLRRICVTPYLAANADRITTENGYYHDERILMDCPFPIKPMDLQEAVDTFNDLIVDFPFETQADRANCFAAAIMPILSVRIPITPLALFGKPAPRTGATLLAEVISIIANGRTPTKMQLSKDADETGKELTSGLQNNSGILLWDNLTGQIDNPIWAQYLTGEDFGKRKLYHDDAHYRISRVGVVDFATANNLSLSTELVKRSFSIRLNARMAEPGERSGFKHPNLAQYARQNRARILSAICSIVQHWIDAGMPAHNGPDVMGGFEQWRITTASILNHAGIDGFLGNSAIFVDQAVHIDEQWITFLNTWWDTHHDNAVTTNQLHELCEPPGGHPLIHLKGKTPPGRTRSLSRQLGENQDSVRRISTGDEVTITRLEKKRGYTYWQLTRLDYADGERH